MTNVPPSGTVTPRSRKNPCLLPPGTSIDSTDPLRGHSVSSKAAPRAQTLNSVEDEKLPDTPDSRAVNGSLAQLLLVLALAVRVTVPATVLVRDGVTDLVAVVLAVVERVRVALGMDPAEGDTDSIGVPVAEPVQRGVRDGRGVDGTVG